MSLLHHTFIITMLCSLVQGFCQEVRSHTGEFESLQDGSKQWGEHLIPDDYLSELPSEEEESAASSTCGCLSVCLQSFYWLALLNLGVGPLCY